MKSIEVYAGQSIDFVVDITELNSIICVSFISPQYSQQIMGREVYKDAEFQVRIQLVDSLTMFKVEKDEKVSDAPETIKHLYHELTEKDNVQRNESCGPENSQKFNYVCYRTGLYRIVFANSQSWYGSK